MASMSCWKNASPNILPHNVQGKLALYSVDILGMCAATPIQIEEHQNCEIASPNCRLTIDKNWDRLFITPTIWLGLAWSDALFLASVFNEATGQVQHKISCALWASAFGEHTFDGINVMLKNREKCFSDSKNQLGLAGLHAIPPCRDIQYWATT